MLITLIAVKTQLWGKKTGEVLTHLNIRDGMPLPRRDELISFIMQQDDDSIPKTYSARVLDVAYVFDNVKLVSIALSV